jgi:hypothetical protein
LIIRILLLRFSTQLLHFISHRRVSLDYFQEKLGHCI